MFNNICLNFSNSCNMHCKYCDVNDQIYDLNFSNKKIREAILDGTFAKNIINKFSHLKKEIIEFSLWGLEPSINFDIAEHLLIPLYDFFENANTLSYSTNCWLGSEIQLQLIKIFESYSRPITIDIQLSTDGPDWITNSSRRRGANDQVLSVAQSLQEISNSLKQVTITSHFKPTLDTFYMNQLVEDDYKFQEYFNYFQELSNKLNTKGKIKFPVGIPTLVLPHYHTINDGHIFKNFLHKINSQEKPFDYFVQGYNSYELYYNGYKSNDLCSAGLYTCSVNYKGDIFGCHNQFALDYNNKKERSIYYGQTTLGGKNEKQVIADQELIHHYGETIRMNLTSLIIALADCGQIEYKYASDKEWRELLIQCIIGLYCPFGLIDTTKSVWIPTTSYIKLYGNGALEELVYHFERLRQNERN